MFQPQCAAHCAAYLLLQAGALMPAGKLLVLMYFAERRWLLHDGTLMTGDDFIALPEGPRLKHITELASGRMQDTEWSRLIQTDSNGNPVLANSVDAEELDMLSVAMIRVLDAVWETYRHWTADELSDLARRPDVSPEYRQAGDDGLIEPAVLLRAHSVPDATVRAVSQHIREIQDWERCIAPLL